MQVAGLSRWMPPQATLVPGGKREFDFCRAEIEETLLTVGIDVIYVGAPSVSSFFQFCEAMEG
jgi:hypothetical protein